MNIVALYSLRECSTAQVLHHLIPSRNDRVYNDGELFGFLEARLLTIEDHT